MSTEIDADFLFYIDCEECTRGATPTEICIIIVCTGGSYPEAVAVSIAVPIVDLLLSCQAVGLHKLNGFGLKQLSRAECFKERDIIVDCGNAACASRYVFLSELEIVYSFTYIFGFIIYMMILLK